MHVSTPMSSAASASLACWPAPIKRPEPECRPVARLGQWKRIGTRCPNPCMQHARPKATIHSAAQHGTAHELHCTPHRAAQPSAAAAPGGVRRRSVTCLSGSGTGRRSAASRAAPAAACPAAARLCASAGRCSAGPPPLQRQGEGKGEEVCVPMQEEVAANSKTHVGQNLASLTLLCSPCAAGQEGIRQPSGNGEARHGTCTSSV